MTLKQREEQRFYDYPTTTKVSHSSQGVIIPTLTANTMEMIPQTSFQTISDGVLSTHYDILTNNACPRKNKPPILIPVNPIAPI
jgi:hypothetical protein